MKTSSHHFGNREHARGQARTIDVHDQQFYRALAGGGSVAAAESWIRGEWSSPDLLAVMRVMAANIDLRERHRRRRIAARHGSRCRALHAFNRNSRAGSQRNIAAHYDLGNDAVRGVSRSDHDVFGGDVSARRRNARSRRRCTSSRTFAASSNSHADDHLLEIGSGWGGMADIRGATLRLPRHHRDAFAASVRLHAERIAASGLADRVTVLLSDYRDLAGTFDKLVSIEMVEAVGERFLPRYFAACGRLLKPRGLMLLQSILIPDQRYRHASSNVDFIQRYIFPGGFLPSSAEILRLVGRETDMRMIDFHDMTADYAATLAAWRTRFHANAARIRELGYDNAFMRLWDFYFCYCEGGFRERVIATAQFLFARQAYRGAEI